MRASFQNGTVQLDKRVNVWYFRWRADGKRKAVRIGTRAEYPTKTKALKASESLKLDINAQRPKTVSYRAVIEKYMRDEMPIRFSTHAGYTSWINNHILPKWGDYEISDVKPLAVQQWLKGLDLAGKSKVNIRGVMQVVFEYAMKLEFMEAARNPMELVKLRGTRREFEPTILTVEQFHKLLDEVGREPFRTMLLTDMCLGLRCSELLGLKWSDVDWEKLSISVQRAIVAGRVDEVKTRYSKARVPLDPALADVLLSWKRKTEFSKPDDWIWASPFTAGEKPYFGWRVQQHIIAPAGIRAGLGRIGWHTLRHTYRSWLDDTGAPMSVQQELMRHASIQTTMNVYGGAMAEGKRAANSKVVRMAIR